MLKPYQQIPIQECHEPLVPIPLAEFSVESPPPYLKLGADYGNASPYFLRATVLQQLQQAQKNLQAQRPQWQLHLFDAYRPLAVQQFMVDYTYQDLLQRQSQPESELTEGDRAEILKQVQTFWAVPSADPATPPPHSTGGAIDLTLVDETGQPLPMGGEIDEIQPYSYPNYYAQAQPNKPEYQYHQNRELLNQVMAQAGFLRHPNEWWHFSSGDQGWCWLQQQAGGGCAAARYGRYEDVLV
ncbi:MAG: M15 family metallopeptidase [Spirulina sp. SIO3F2]|nr:M15 family metallopeptidase [Spirulina sp. SIO3F2]